MESIIFSGIVAEIPRALALHLNLEEQVHYQR